MDFVLNQEPMKNPSALHNKSSKQVNELLQRVKTVRAHPLLLAVKLVQDCLSRYVPETLKHVAGT